MGWSRVIAMQIIRKAIAATSLAAPTLLALTLVPSVANAHGTMNNPISRAMVCYNENPERPQSEACKKTVQLGGTQPLYDWNEVNIANAGGRHRQIIPDGQLCSAGRDKYRGLDQARADWPATTLASGAAFTFRYRVTAAHRGGFELYVTRDGYNPAQPLKWSDLEDKPFLTQPDPTVSNGFYVMDGKLPVKKGRHLIYAIWQRTDSPEAFYSCSDVVFGGGSATTPSSAPTSAPTGRPSTPATTKPSTSPSTPPGGGSTPPGGGATIAGINSGVGISPAAPRVGGEVTVTAVCNGSQVSRIVSNAFTPARSNATVPTVAWAPSIRAARAGTFPVTAYCKNGGMARTSITVQR